MFSHKRCLVQTLLLKSQSVFVDSVLKCVSTVSQVFSHKRCLVQTLLLKSQSVFVDSVLGVCAPSVHLVSFTLSAAFRPCGVHLGSFVERVLVDEFRVAVGVFRPRE